MKCLHCRQLLTVVDSKRNPVVTYIYNIYIYIFIYICHTVRGTPPHFYVLCTLVIFYTHAHGLRPKLLTIGSKPLPPLA